MRERDAQVSVERRMAADPASAVLLLAAPSAAELWPGVALTAAEPGDHIEVTVTLPGEAARQAGLPPNVAALVRAAPPQRTPTSFVLRFSFVADGVPPTTGTLTLTYAPGGDEQASATMARLVFTVAARFVTPPFVRALEHSAQRFLDNMATLAEARSHAA
ncbi:MAG: hypothetical protein ACJ735_04850 [Actinomycetes bacterium]